MRARILNHDEWSKLDGKDLGKILPFAEPQNISVVVVEDEGGSIIACLAAIRVTHMEGTWIAPEHRKRGGTLRALLREALAIPRERRERWAFGSADDANEEVNLYLRRMGGVAVPVALYALPLGGH